MRVQVAGRHVELGQALQTRINDDLGRTIEKYFPRSGEAVVTVAREGGGFEVDCSVHLPSGIVLQAEGSGGDAHGAFENALEKMEKRVRRYKRRLKNHHNTQKEPLPAESATAYVLKSDQDQAEADESEAAAGEAPDGAPLVIAETTVSVKTMTVSMAVLQLDLADSPALLFRNAANGGLNLVYRRPDGNVGWVDPQRANGGVEQHNGDAR
ncbi:MAG TPA: ribosome-associated translation inhibitor RaiA [Caulobacterales bacterium]|nr:ribosome-associated translation inhibitor RaiA [Caulobacterales bacterium]